MSGLVIETCKAWNEEKKFRCDKPRWAGSLFCYEHAMENGAQFPTEATGSIPQHVLDDATMLEDMDDL